MTKGYLAGGLNAYGNDPDNAKFDEQTSMNYEVGAKTAWLDDRLFFNSTLFHIDIGDMHLATGSRKDYSICSTSKIVPLSKNNSRGASGPASRICFNFFRLSSLAPWVTSG